MLALGKLLELTLAGREPAQKIQLTADGVHQHLVTEWRQPATALHVLAAAGVKGLPCELLLEALGATRHGAAHMGLARGAGAGGQDELGQARQAGVVVRQGRVQLRQCLVFQ